MTWLAPTGHSGVADYARTLRAALPPIRGVTVFHVGNNQLHQPIYQRLIARQDPKQVVILHDAVLQHFMLGSLSEKDYVEEFVYNYGEWQRDQAQDLWQRRAQSGSAPEYFAYPMLRRAMEAAHLVIVHNPAAERLAREHGATRTELLPHFIECHAPPPAQQIARWRESQGFAADTCLFGVFGHLRESKRVPAIVKAISQQPPQTVALLVQGEWGSAALRDSLDPAGDPAGDPARVIRIGPVPEDEFRLLIAAIDVGLNLRYPSAGESSGVLARLMAAAKPALVTQGDEVSHLPPGIVWPIPAGPSEHDALTYAIAYLARHRTSRTEMGRAARAYAETVCSVPVLARRLSQILVTVCQSV